MIQVPPLVLAPRPPQYSAAGLVVKREPSTRRTKALIAAPPPGLARHRATTELVDALLGTGSTVGGFQPPTKPVTITSAKGISIPTPTLRFPLYRTLTFDVQVMVPSTPRWSVFDHVTPRSLPAPEPDPIPEPTGSWGTCMITPNDDSLWRARARTGEELATKIRAVNIRVTVKVPTDCPEHEVKGHVDRATWKLILARYETLQQQYLDHQQIDRLNELERWFTQVAEPAPDPKRADYLEEHADWLQREHIRVTTKRSEYCALDARPLLLN